MSAEAALTVPSTCKLNWGMLGQHMAAVGSYVGLAPIPLSINSLPGLTLQVVPRLVLRMQSLRAICATFGPATLLYLAKMCAYLLVQVRVGPCCWHTTACSFSTDRTLPHSCAPHIYWCWCRAVP